MAIFTFMGEHPILTFFLALIISQCVVNSIMAIRGHCDNCRCDEDEV